MKLYFYILETYKQKPQLIISDCDVVEKPKTYHPATKFPDDIYRSFVKKEDINHISGYQNNVVILLQPDLERAKELFFKLHDQKIKVLQATIQKEKIILKTIEEAKQEDKE